jgi:2-oxo-3-hexenedioate decarboxylase
MRGTEPSAPASVTMTPQELLRHADTGEIWPAESGADFGDLPAAYGLALAVRALRIARGEMPCGYKVGFTNRTIWPRYNVYAPIWGTMWKTTVAHCDGEGRVALAHLCQPRIEPEAVFGFRAAPAADAGLDELFEALDWVAPGFEVVQSHRPDWKFNAAQSVADGGLHGRLLVGSRVPVAQLAGTAGELHERLARARVTLRRNGRAVEVGAGAHVLDSPLRALAHFIAELRACPGAPGVAAGDIVTTGTWTDAWPVDAGEDWSAHHDSLLPALAVRFC